LQHCVYFGDLPGPQSSVIVRPHLKQKTAQTENRPEAVSHALRCEFDQPGVPRSIRNFPSLGEIGAPNGLVDRAAQAPATFAPARELRQASR